MQRVAAALIGALPLFALSANCPAAAPDDVPTQLVRFADLDLTRPTGVQALYHRIQHAARDVCNTYDSRGYSSQALYRECASAAIARAVADVGSPLLTEYHEARTHTQSLQPRLARLNR